MFLRGTILITLAVVLPITLCDPQPDVVPNGKVDTPVEKILHCLAENLVDLLPANAAKNVKEQLVNQLDKDLEVIY